MLAAPCACLGHRLHNPWQLQPWGCKTQSCPRSSHSLRADLTCQGCQAFQNLRTIKLGKSSFPTETGQNLQLLNAPGIVDVKARAKCWMLAQRGRDGDKKDHFSFFNTLFSNKAPVVCAHQALLWWGVRAVLCWVAVPAPVPRQGCPGLMWPGAIPHNYYEQVLFSLEIKGLLSKCPIFMKYCFFCGQV